MGNLLWLLQLAAAALVVVVVVVVIVAFAVEVVVSAESLTSILFEPGWASGPTNERYSRARAVRVNCKLEKRPRNGMSRKCCCKQSSVCKQAAINERTEMNKRV